MSARVGVSRSDPNAEPPQATVAAPLRQVCVVGTTWLVPVTTSCPIVAPVALTASEKVTTAGAVSDAGALMVAWGTTVSRVLVSVAAAAFPAASVAVATMVCEPSAKPLTCRNPGQAVAVPSSVQVSVDAPSLLSATNPVVVLTRLPLAGPATKTGAAGAVVSTVHV